MNTKTNKTQKENKRCHKKLAEPVFELVCLRSRIIINLKTAYDSMALDWFNIRKCAIPEFQEMFKAIRFIRLKLESSRGNIVKEYEKVRKELKVKATKTMEYYLRINPRIEFIPEEFRDYSFEGIEGEKDLFFHIDSFIIDLKREIEFILRFIAQVNNIKLKKFSLENVTDQIDPKYEGSKCELVKFLLDKHPSYIKFLSDELDWLKQLNGKRKILIHDGILNRTDRYTVTFHWPAKSDEKTEPEVIMPEIGMFNHAIPIWIDFQMKKLDLFIKESFKVLGRVLDYQSTIKKREKRPFFQQIKIENKKIEKTEELVRKKSQNDPGGNY